MNFISNFITSHPFIAGGLAIFFALVLFVAVLIFYLYKINPPQLVDANERPINKKEISRDGEN